MHPPGTAGNQSIAASANDHNQMMYPQVQNWQNGQWQNLGGQPMDQSLGLYQQNTNPAQPQSAPYGSLPSNSSHLSTMPLPHRNSGSSTNSPQNHFAPTPSLTSHTTSPSGSDEPAEGRQSSVSFSDVWTNNQAQGPDASHGKEGYNQTSASPTAPNAMANIPGAAVFQTDMNLFAWAPPATTTIDPRTQFRGSLAAEDEPETVDPSRPASSAASTYLEGLDEDAVNALNQRRRMSVGGTVWASAFDQMSLQDPAPIIPPDPYTASQMAQATTARRPTFPLIQPTPDGNGNKMPSLGDVKDLWKLFMAEPMSSAMIPSSSTDNVETGHNPAVTPRPGLGARGLSKSNSMPDLTSPMIANQPFFSTYLNGVTPKPTIPQASYTHAQIPDGAPPQADDKANGGDDMITMKRWKDSIKNRQDSFEFDTNAHAKLKATSPQSVSSASPPTTTSLATENNPSLTAMAAIGAPSQARPQASALQHSSALQQTLAPERLPSFGMDPLQGKNAWMFRQNAAKFSSALARPGNKRLASQTLVPAETGKKFEMDGMDGSGWEAGDGSGSMAFDPTLLGGDSKAFALPTSLGGLGTGMTPNVVGGNQYFTWHGSAHNPAT
jgi:hypothetical protein